MRISESWSGGSAWVAGAGALALLSSANAGAQKAAWPVKRPPLPPNILIVVADDLGVDMVGAYGEGSDLPPTPTIDSLATGGLLFRNAWARPGCSPTRATIQTGREGFRTGVGWGVGPGDWAMNPSETTLPELLDLGTKGAYSHAAFGKWHLGNASVGGDNSPNVAGYGHFNGTLDNFEPPHDYYNWIKVVDGVSSISTTYATTDTVDATLAWITTTPQPWFAYVAFNAPHIPYHAPPPNLHTIDLSQPNDRKYYKAMTQAMDTELGRLLAGISPEVRKNTVIIFLGDNGTPRAVTVSPFVPKHGKTTLYEGGVNVPLIVNGPVVAQPGSEVTGIVSTTDLFATVGDIARVDWTLVPRPSDSTSMAPYFSDPSQPSLRAYVYSEIFRPNAASGPPVPPPCPVLPVCQTDLGSGGPGTSRLSVCGEPLYFGYLDIDQDATLTLLAAPPNAAGSLLIRRDKNPTQIYGGTIIPYPPDQQIPIMTDAAGTFTMTVSPSLLVLGPEYYQVIVEDSNQPGGYDISNAVEVMTLPSNMKAIQDGRYKLIEDEMMCQEVFYDLLTDPWEATDLISAGMTPAQQAAYQDLKSALANWTN